MDTSLCLKCGFLSISFVITAVQVNIFECQLGILFFENYLFASFWELPQGSLSFLFCFVLIICEFTVRDNYPLLVISPPNYP